jgi:hypothetical protein
LAKPRLRGHKAEYSELAGRASSPLFGSVASHSDVQFALIIDRQIRRTTLGNNPGPCAGRRCAPFLTWQPAVLCKQWQVLGTPRFRDTMSVTLFNERLCRACNPRELHATLIGTQATISFATCLIPNQRLLVCAAVRFCVCWHRWMLCHASRPTSPWSYGQPASPWGD